MVIFLHQSEKRLKSIGCANKIVANKFGGRRRICENRKILFVRERYHVPHVLLLLEREHIISIYPNGKERKQSMKRKVIAMAASELKST